MCALIVGCQSHWHVIQRHNSMQLIIEMPITDSKLQSLSHCYFSSVVPMYDLPPELWNTNLVQQAPASPGTDVWLQMWLSSLSTTCAQEIPLTAMNIHTPLSVSA